MKYIIVLFSLFHCLNVSAQTGTDQQLANFYFSAGEYEKALPYCQKVFNKDNNKANFMRYFDCLNYMGDDKQAEKILKKQISTDRNQLDYSILLGNFYETKDRTKEATKIYQNLVDDYAVSTLTISDLYKSFKASGKLDWALTTLEKGRKIFKSGYPLNMEFAEIYGLQQKKDKMIEEYFQFLDENSMNALVVQNALEERITFVPENPDYELVKEKLIVKTQKKPTDYVYTEMLIWLFSQSKQFNAALIQAQALDKRQKAEGKRVYELGITCVQNKEYQIARKAFQYVVSLGDKGSMFYEAEFALLNTRYHEITQNRNYTIDELNAAISDYETTIQRVGKSRTTLRLIMELAEIKAFYANRSGDAQKLLEEALLIPGLTSIQQAEIKIALGDIFVIQNDIWSASILYMQVDRDFKYEPIGFEAKFKNARIFYYDGDFDFAQNQLDVLKQSTTKLIANDAMKLSLLITENYGLDSNYTAMSKFAQADLLIQQHQYEQAFSIFDSIIAEFPFHELSDEILLRKSLAMQNQGKWTEAISYLNQLLKYHSDQILADDAVFQLADIYENHLINLEKAMEYYKKILFDYKGSLYTNEARKRLRILRGDVLIGEEL
jgi:tetratricopeptide (TPR) repeat protein